MVENKLLQQYRYSKMHTPQCQTTRSAVLIETQGEESLLRLP